MPAGIYRSVSKETLPHSTSPHSFPFPAVPRKPLSVLSSPLPSQHSPWLLCHFHFLSFEIQNFSVPNPSPLLSIPIQRLTSNSSPGSLLSSWTEVVTATNMGERWGLYFPLQVIFSSFHIVYSLSESYFCSHSLQCS